MNEKQLSQKEIALMSENFMKQNLLYKGFDVDECDRYL
jgi:hypothetical protein